MKEQKLFLKSFIFLIFIFVSSAFLSSACATKNFVKSLTLSGNWFFWPNDLLSPEQVDAELATDRTTIQTIKVPSRWQRLGVFEKTESLIKTGTVAIDVELDSLGEWGIRVPNADSACSVFINGDYIGSVGQVSNLESTHIPSNMLLIKRFNATNKDCRIIMQISNFSTPYTGTWDAPIISPYSAMEKQHIRSIIINSLISGALLFMSFYHLSLYFFRKKDTSSLVFGIMCALMAIRNMIMRERILISLLPMTTTFWEWGFKLEHISAHMVLPLFFVFFKIIFPEEMKTIAVKIVLGVSAAWLFLIIGFPAMIYHRFLSFFEYFILVSAVYALFTLIVAIIRKRSGSVFILLGIICLLGTSVNDVLLSNGIIEGSYLSSVGMFLFCFSQSQFLALRFSRLFFEIANSKKSLEVLNKSLERFIPHEMFHFLNKNSITEVQLGDFTQQFMTVLFLDLRCFTSRSEKMTPEENFKFINTFLRHFGPIVRKSDGFIDKYLGDGFMALFPSNPDSALKAALQMRKTLLLFNQVYLKNKETLKLGIGIHSGTVTLGTIGETQRMDSTVISDTVNTASRIEDLTKEKDIDILISAATIKKLLTPEVFQYRKMGEEKVRGKDAAIELYTLD